MKDMLGVLKERSRIAEVVAQVASELRVSKRLAVKAIVQVDNQDLGHIRNKVGPARARLIRSILARSGYTLRNFVSRKIPLMSIPPDLEHQLTAGRLSLSHVLLLLGVSDLKVRTVARDRVLRDRISVRGLRELLAVGSGPTDTSLRTDLESVSSRLSRELGFRVVLSDSELRICFGSLEMLDGVLDRLGVSL